MTDNELDQLMQRVLLDAIKRDCEKENSVVPSFEPSLRYQLQSRSNDSRSFEMGTQACKAVVEKYPTKGRSCPYYFLLKPWQSDGGQSEHSCCSCELGD